MQKKSNRIIILLNLFIIAFIIFGCAKNNDEIKIEKVVYTEVVNSVTAVNKENNNVEETIFNEVIKNENEETLAIDENERVDENNAEKLQKFISANTADNILKNYFSFQFFDYKLNKNGAKTVYFEGYEDRQGNMAIRYKSPTENTQYSFQNAPYYVRTDKGKYEVVEGENSSVLPKNHWLNIQENIDSDVIENDFINKSVIPSYAKFISDDDKNDKGVLTVEVPFSKIIEINNNAIYLYKEVLDVGDIDTILIEYEYDKNTLVIKKETDIAVSIDGNSYVTSNIIFEYDVNVLTAIKVVNDEEGEVVYFDTKKLEKANVYNQVKKDLVSFMAKDTKYDINGNIIHDFLIYKDEDGYIVIKDVKVKEKGENLSNPMYHVKYEKKWYDVVGDSVTPTSLNSEEINAYELDPIISVTGLRSLIDSNEKVITSYEENGIGVIIQEQKELNGDKLYRASILPGIEGVTKTRREVRYNMDDDIVKSYELTSYVGSKKYIVEKCEIYLDENEPVQLEKVMSYVDDME